MNARVRIALRPLGVEVEIEKGAPLQDALFPHGVEFPCGGQGRCRGCLVRVLEGSLEETGERSDRLADKERAAGWRQACRCAAQADVTLVLAKWEAPILGDDSRFSFEPRVGLGVAIDLSTTTLVGQLVDLSTGQVLAVRSALNNQARHGADVMTRVGSARSPEGRRRLVKLIRAQLGRLIKELTEAAKTPPSDLKRIILVGNTVMHHLFCDLDPTPLAVLPFESPQLDRVDLRPSDLDWDLSAECAIRFLPCIGGFVGSDVLAGIVATGLHESAEPVALVDLGTNGEIAVGDRDGILCASTAAGPAFEGARISMGMRAATGAVSRVSIEDGAMQCRTLGDVEPRGICGSGLVDAVAGALELGLVQPSGRLPEGWDLVLAGPVRLTQTDIRELQLAKGAIAAGLGILTHRRGVRESSLARVDLAGAFGNYLNLASARRIGLIARPPDCVRPVGNAALLGAKMALFDDDLDLWDAIRRKVEHVGLGADPEFMDAYVAAMAFPKTPHPQTSPSPSLRPSAVS